MDNNFNRILIVILLVFTKTSVVLAKCDKVDTEFLIDDTTSTYFFEGDSLTYHEYQFVREVFYITNHGGIYPQNAVGKYSTKEGLKNLQLLIFYQNFYEKRSRGYYNYQSFVYDDFYGVFGFNNNISKHDLMNIENADSTILFGRQLGLLTKILSPRSLMDSTELLNTISKFSLNYNVHYDAYFGINHSVYYALLLKVMITTKIDYPTLQKLLKIVPKSLKNETLKLIGLIIINSRQDLMCSFFSEDEGKMIKLNSLYETIQQFTPYSIVLFEEMNYLGNPSNR